MLHVLHRTAGGSVILDRPSRLHDERRSPPPPEQPTGVPESTPRWPFGAKAVVAVLAVLALAGAIGTIIGITGDDDVTTTGLQATVDDQSAELDLLRGVRAEQADRIESLEASLATNEGERDAALAEVDRLTAVNETVTADRDDLAVELDVAAIAVEGLEADLAEAEADLAAQVDLTAAAVTERDALAALFPLKVDTTLARADLAGKYDVDISAVYCDGFSNCGVLPGFDELRIVETSQGWLRVQIDGYFEGGLFVAEGSLMAVAGTMTAVPGCAGVPRHATVSLTLFARDLTVADDGVQVIEGLGATMMVQANATAGCPYGLAFYGLELTPTG